MSGAATIEIQELEVKPAKYDDLRDLVSLLGASVPDCIPQTVWELPWKWHHYRVVRNDEGELVAAGSLQPIGGDRAEVRGLTVCRQWRGHGIARKLLDHLIQLAEQCGLEVVCVTSSPKFFNEFGFHDTTPTWLDYRRRRVAPGRSADKLRVAMSRPREAYS